MTKKISFTVNSRKLDNSIQRSWQCDLLEKGDNLLILEGVFEKEVNHPQIGVIRRGTISTEYFWFDRWFNIFRFENPGKKLVGFYCNVNLPPVINGSVLDYVDLDLDVFVDAEFNFRVLDFDEFQAGIKKYQYNMAIIEKAENALDEIIVMIEKREFPFNISL